MVVTDVELGPGMNGLTLVEEVQRRWPGVAVVVMTGNPAKVDGRSFGQREVFVAKPFGAGMLVSAVRELMERSQR